MKTSVSTALLLILSSTIQGKDLTPFAIHGKENFLADEHLQETREQPANLALEIDPNDKVLIPRMKGLLLLGSLDQWEKNPDVEGIQLKGLILPGNANKLLKRLSTLIVGQPLSQSKISLIRREIISYYQANNHPVVAVIVPQQDITDGVLQIGVMEGKIGTVNARGGKYFSPERMKSKFPLVEGETINTDELLSNVAWANKNPFRQTNVIFSPGASQGTTNIDIVTNDRFPLRVYVGGDNTGNKYTGRNRWYTGFNWGDLFGLDQTLSFQYTTATHPHKLQSYTLNYNIPLPWHNTLTVYGGYSRIHPDAFDANGCKDNHVKTKGWSGQASMRYNIPVGKTYGNFLQNAQVGYDFKSTNNITLFQGYNESTKVSRLNQFLVSYYIGYTPNHHKINADIDVYFSPGNWFGKNNKKAFEKQTDHAKTSYVYTRIALGDEFVFSKYRFGLYALGRAQLANNTLIPSEQFGLGGYDTVRGYYQRIVNYDNAFCLNFELRLPSFSLLRCFSKYKADTLTFLGFIDYGIGWPHQSGCLNNSGNNLDPKTQTLLGVGPGLRYRLGPWVYARLDYGYPLTKIAQQHQHPILDFGLMASY